MANINHFIPFLLKWEGGFVNDPLDAGGPTNMGVTLKTWQAVGYDKNDDGIIDEKDLQLIFRQDLIESVLRPHYWDRWQADRIRNQSIAHIVVDWLWMSGMVGIKTPQRILDVKVDGIVGEKTLAAVNNHPSPQDLFEQIKSERAAYIEKICLARPANQRFRKGWFNRLADIRFTAMLLFMVLCCCFSSCKSLSRISTFQSDSEMVVDVKTESTTISGSQMNELTSTQSEQQVKENTLQEAVIIRFDTSLSKDSLTGMHPVKEIIIATVATGVETQSTLVDTGQKYEAQSQIERSEEQMQLTGKETSESQTAPVKQSRRCQTFASIVLIICTFIYLLLCLLNHRKNVKNKT